MKSRAKANEKIVRTVGVAGLRLPPPPTMLVWFIGFGPSFHSGPQCLPCGVLPLLSYIFHLADARKRSVGSHGGGGGRSCMGLLSSFWKAFEVFGGQGLPLKRPLPRRLKCLYKAL